ncbi:hypothetical protein AMJ96_CH00482 [Rhizobium sp. N113]|nr:hypothetical protein AMJ96_CH00482 [Rhizobium sp. N113]
MATNRPIAGMFPICGCCRRIGLRPHQPTPVGAASEAGITCADVPHDKEPHHMLASSTGSSILAQQIGRGNADSRGWPDRQLRIFGVAQHGL